MEKIAIVPIVIGLTQLVKQSFLAETGARNAKILPLVALAVAIGIGSLQEFAPNLYDTFLEWIIWGLTASGLYGAGGDLIKKSGKFINSTDK